jgi:5'-3' exonuclease
LFIDIINEENEDNIDGIKKIIYNCYINLLIEKKMLAENIIFYFDNIWISDNHLINFLEEYVRINLNTDAYIIHLQYRLLMSIHDLPTKYNTFLNKLYNINNDIFTNNNSIILNIEYRLIESDFNEFLEKKKNKHIANLLLSFSGII